MSNYHDALFDLMLNSIIDCRLCGMVDSNGRIMAWNYYGYVCAPALS